MNVNIDLKINEELIASFNSKIEEIAAGVYNIIKKKENYGIDGSTFRAFRHIDAPPSLKYRRRAALCTLELENENFISINSQDEFDEWHFKFSEAFNDAFENKLSFSQKMKLTDLYFKWAYQNDEINSTARNVIHRYGYCPLDSIILKRMNACFNNFLPLGD